MSHSRKKSSLLTIASNDYFSKEIVSIVNSLLTSLFSPPSAYSISRKKAYRPRRHKSCISITKMKWLIPVIKQEKFMRKIIGTVSKTGIYAVINSDGSRGVDGEMHPGQSPHRHENLFLLYSRFV